MLRSRILAAAFLLTAAFPWAAQSSTANLNFASTGVSANLIITYGATTDATVKSGYVITGISGTFTDTNSGLNIVNQSVVGLVPINPTTPADPTNIGIAPANFSLFAVAAGLTPPHTALSYDNLFYPGGSPDVAAPQNYPFSGGILDIYGLLFSIGNNQVVDIWSNGNTPGSVPSDIYGLTVATAQKDLDYESSGITLTPEPNVSVLTGTGFLALWLSRRAARCWAGR